MRINAPGAFVVADHQTASVAVWPVLREIRAPDRAIGTTTRRAVDRASPGAGGWAVLAVGLALIVNRQSPLNGVPRAHALRPSRGGSHQRCGQDPFRDRSCGASRGDAGAS